MHEPDRIHSLLSVLEDALAGVCRLLAERQGAQSLQSIVEQLEYLIAYAKAENDGAKLGGINIGVLAMREVEDADLRLAMTLHRIGNEAAKEYFAIRRARAKPGRFEELLRRAPNRPPIPGDEIE